MYIPYSEKELDEALKLLGIKELDDLFTHIDKNLFSKVNLDEPKSEEEIRKIFEQLGCLNSKVINFAGFGIYDRIIPSVIPYLLTRGEFMTAYTPYQSEASQGTLQIMFEYQSVIAELTGMDVANASMYDGATALAEALLMASNIKKGKRILISEGVHPFYKRVIKTYLYNKEFELEEIGLTGEGTTSADRLKDLMKKGDTIAVALQYPNFLGFVEPLKDLASVVKEHDALFIIVADPIALAVLEPPSSFGADIVVGEGQQMGIPMNLGGPGIGFFATKREYIRNMPGRICGLGEDIEGNKAFTLVLQTREQHIRRERATSNICTNQQLLAFANLLYIVLLGKEGLKEVAVQSTSKAFYLRKKLERLGFTVPFKGKHLWEFPVKHPEAEYMYREAKENGFILGVPLWKYGNYENTLLIAVTEKRKREEMDQLAEILSS